jgi:acyl-coenzyme A thioesterase PaaI-like protein
MSSADPASAFVDNDYCFACGSRNPLGLNLTFFRAGERLCTRVTPLPHWQGFAGVVHGGLQATIMDDLMSNHLARLHGIWAVTADLAMRFRGPAPLDRPLLFSSRVEKHSGRLWVLEADCRVAGEPEGRALCEATGRFMEVSRPADRSRGGD